MPLELDQVKKFSETILFQMDFFRKTGMMALGSRLRMLSEKVTSDAAGIYEM